MPLLLVIIGRTRDLDNLMMVAQAAFPEVPVFPDLLSSTASSTTFSRLSRPLQHWHEGKRVHIFWNISIRSTHLPGWDYLGDMGID